jgi:hypothetical protein
LEKPDPTTERLRCQRYYYADAFRFVVYQGAASGFGCMQSLPATMRATPTTTINSVTQTNCSGGAVTGWSNGVVYPNAVATATGAVIFTGNYTASAEL